MVLFLTAATAAGATAVVARQWVHGGGRGGGNVEWVVYDWGAEVAEGAEGWGWMMCIASAQA
eukprot:1146901-Pelagomonas_calceolata.AAC.9